MYEDVLGKVPAGVGQSAPDVDLLEKKIGGDGPSEKKILQLVSPAAQLFRILRLGVCLQLEKSWRIIFVLFLSFLPRGLHEKVGCVTSPPTPVCTSPELVYKSEGCWPP